jgi:putative hydrolase of the HAD superfamily
MSIKPKLFREMQPSVHGPQTLLFDADDTLWENYIYFEQAIADFIAFLDHQQHSAEQVREVLNDCEAQNIRLMGYGLLSFERSLVQCFQQLMATPPTGEQRARIAAFAHRIATQPVVLLPGVQATLEQLDARHTLVLVTKGHPLEQTDKLRRSGLQTLFSHIEVLPEKSPEAYVDLRSRHCWQAETCWMIGNSPKSDIHSPLAAGLHAVHVPHEQTWILEHCEVMQPRPPQQLLRLQRFTELTDIF